MTINYFYKNYVQPHLKAHDKPFNRQLFHEAKDALHKDGEITDEQVNNWIYPMNRFFK